MKIVMMSDNHNSYSGLDIPDGDVFIHSGDYSGHGTLQELSAFNTWLGKLKHACKLFVPGNHDGLFQTDPSLAKGVLTNAITLIDSSFDWKGIKFYGTPWQPFFNNWYFNVQDDSKRTELFNKIPDTTNVLITHCPPYDVLDKNCEGELCGDLMLTRRISSLRALRLHVFGHIHDGAGSKFLEPVTYINSSVMNDHYKLVNKPSVFEL